MGGGLFGTPLYLNLKCIIFSIILIIVYYLPHPHSTAHNIVFLFLLGVSAYISMAWYDVLYDCNDRLKPTILGSISKPFKPAEYSDQFDKLPIKYKKIIRDVDIGILSILGLTLLYPIVF